MTSGLDCTGAGGGSGIDRSPQCIFDRQQASEFRDRNGCLHGPFGGLTQLGHGAGSLRHPGLEAADYRAGVRAGRQPELQRCKPTIRRKAHEATYPGTLGKAAAGLALLQSGNADAISAYDELVNFQRRPQPPISVGVSAAVAGPTSMLDLSDGLSRDAARIAKASNVTVSLNRRDLQGFEAMLEEAARAIGANAFDWVLDGGEDHSLLATFAAGSQIPRDFKPIGEIVARTNHDVLLDLAPVAEGGWDSVRD